MNIKHDNLFFLALVIIFGSILFFNLYIKDEESRPYEECVEVYSLNAGPQCE